MKRLLPFLLAAASAFAVDGTVVNKTTGKPAARATVTLFRLGGPSGPESTGDPITTDASGKFSFPVQLQGPAMVQTAFDGVLYSRMLPSGTPSTGVSIEVYNATRTPGSAKVAQHFVLLEPDGQNLSVTESFLWQNTGATTYYDLATGPLRIYLPGDAAKNAVVNVTGPGSVPIRRAAEKTAMADVYKIDFPIRPGETNIQVGYSIPFTTPGSFAGKVLVKTEVSSLIIPVGVTAKGDGLTARGQEPRTKASIFQFKSAAFKVDLDGTGSLRAPQGDTGGGGGGGGNVEPTLPKIYTRVYWVLGFASGILVLGFVLLYRRNRPAVVVAEAQPAPKRKK